ncbi:MAG: phosphopentomutase [Candidatus Thermoplasmatota archaeon]
MIDRVIWIVLDSVGVGASPDAEEYGDPGADTLNHVAYHVGGLALPHMRDLGLGNIEGVTEITKVKEPKACYGRSAERSAGKGTTVGHWEMVGIQKDEPFPTYPNGFPDEVIEAFEEAVGKEVLGNRPESGTVIIEELGPEHEETGKPIVYTSADSVFQIAAHKDVVSLEELYTMCREAREILQGEHGVGRVIARPFVGEHGSYTRTAERKDFSIRPPEETLLNRLEGEGYDVIGIGKIDDIFAGDGITEAIHTEDNMDGVDRTIEQMGKDNTGLIMTNLVDFDMRWGHRNDPEAYGEGLGDFDERIPELLEAMGEKDVLIITADHGCDPTYEGTDHTREYVPLLLYGSSLDEGVDLGTRSTFSDLGQTVADMFSLGDLPHGSSFLSSIEKASERKVI